MNSGHFTTSDLLLQRQQIAGSCSEKGVTGISVAPFRDTHSVPCPPPMSLPRTGSPQKAARVVGGKKYGGRMCHFRQQCRTQGGSVTAGRGEVDGSYVSMKCKSVSSSEFPGSDSTYRTARADTSGLRDHVRAVTRASPTGCGGEASAQTDSTCRVKPPVCHGAKLVS